MNVYTRFLIAALLLVLAVSVSAAPIYIPRDTVIPVTIDKALGSATSRVGRTFYAHYTGINGGGFPEQTRFTGHIDSVTKASGNAAGQIGVSFLGAKLPDGTRIPIVGQLASLDNNSVVTDTTTGRLVSKSNTSKNNLKFTAIGAGAGLVLGQVIGKKPLIGTLLGAAAGYIYGANKTRPAAGRDVLIPAGTPFGILLSEDVTIPNSWTTPSASASNASMVAGPIGPGWQVSFNNLQPVMSGNDLMVPFRSVMDSIDMAFDYNSSTRQVRVSNYESQTIHTVGTSIVNENGRSIMMDTPSRVINGAIYVPASFIELLTQRTAYWNQRSRVLRIE